MKIFVQENNYTADEGFYLVPDTALVTRGRPFFVPDFAMPCTASLHVVVRISRLGKGIAERFAYRYYDAVSVGVCFTAEALLRKLRAAGQPWEAAKGFDGAAHVGTFVPVAEAGPLSSLCATLQRNGTTTLQQNANKLLQTTEAQISRLSHIYRLAQGDLLFLGSSGRVTVDLDDRLTVTLTSSATASLPDKPLLAFNVK